jgi:hypothetical protein
MVWAHRPHWAAQPSEAYTRLIRGRSALPAIAARTWVSLNTLHEHTIIAAS